MTGPARTAAERAQRGAALVTALFFLVVLTLLGLAAMQAGRVDLRLSLNEESRVDAMQSAQSALDLALDSESNLAVLPNAGQMQSCYVGSRLSAGTLAAEHDFSCSSNTTALELNTFFRQYTYIGIRRERVGDNDFAPASALRAGDSGDRFRYAAFAVTAGYDRTAERQGAAEIEQGIYRKVAIVDNLSLQ